MVLVILSIILYLKNGTLQDEIESNQKAGNYIKTSRIINFFSCICDATNFIHEKNLAHRDLKPHNVLISDDRKTPILSDYGSMTERIIEISNLRKVQEIQDWAAQNCSMFFRAPELFDPKIGSSITEKSDIWSLGCILYALMFNKGPFDYVCEKGTNLTNYETN